MLHLSFLPIAGILGLGLPELFTLLLVLGLTLVLPISLVAMSLYFKHRQRQMWHETARLALEKGQPIPTQGAPDAFRDRPHGGGTDLNHHDLRGGLVLMAVGLGLYWFIGPVGYIPGFIGVALVVYALISRIFPAKKSDNPPAPPRQ